MRKTWTEQGWDDYLYWQGKPEPLRGDLQGFWSRRIDEKNRLVYSITADDTICIIGCRGHYEK